MANKRITELNPAGPLTGNELVELVQHSGSGFGNVQAPLTDIVQQLALQGPQGEQGLQGEPGPVGSAGPQGAQGPAGLDGTDGTNGADGADGDDGWSPVFAIVSDGTRRVLQVTAWTGGTGSSPASGAYVGATGLVSAIADAIDIRGPQGSSGPQGAQGPPGEQGPQGAQGSAGPQGAQGSLGPAGPAGANGAAGTDGDDGWSPVFAVVTDSARRVLQVASWTAGVGTPPASGKFVGPTGFVDAIGDGVDIRGAVGAAGAAGSNGAAGPAGATGPTGATGPAGANGAGVPTGGTTGQVLAKASNTDLDSHWIDPPAGGGGGSGARTINTQTANYTLQLIDAGCLVEMNVAGANNLTVPDNATVAFALGTQIDVAQYGAGQTTLVPGAGVTIVSVNSNKKLFARYSTATLYKRATNEWLLTGDLVA